MRSFNFFIALLFTFIGTSIALPDFFHDLEARKNKNGTSNGNSVNKQCKKIQKLTALTDLANNQTRLDALVAKGKLDTAKVDSIKAEAANATATLQTMQANTTLVGECAVIDAHQKVVSSCKKINKLQKWAGMANNQTAIDAIVAKKKLNETQVTKLKEKIANATTKLQEMQTNTTLTNLCATELNQKGSATSGSNAAGASQAPSTTDAKGSAAALTAQTLPYIIGVATLFAFL